MIASGEGVSARMPRGPALAPTDEAQRALEVSLPALLDDLSAYR